MIENLVNYILYAIAKYETYFQFNKIDSMDASHVMVQKCQRLKEILKECQEKERSEEQLIDLYSTEVGDLHYDIKCKEFVCKVSRIAYLGGMKMIAEFWGDYYTEIDFEEILNLPEVQEKYPEFEKIKEPEVFNKVFPFEYHVFFGEQPERVDVSSGFIWNYGKRMKEPIDVENYEWIRGF